MKEQNRFVLVSVIGQVLCAAILLQL